MKSLRNLLLVALLAVLASCSNDTTAPPPSDEGRITAGGTGEILLAVVSYGGGTLEIHASNLLWDLSLETANMDLTLTNSGAVGILAPVALVVTHIDPNSVALTNPDGETSDEYPYKLFDDEFGSDTTLEPNEVSEPVGVTFDVGSVRSFALKFRIDEAGAGGHIAGTVFDDRNANGVRDDAEPGLFGIAVTLESNHYSTTTQTGAGGVYLLSGLSAGAYTIDVVPNGIGVTTATPIVVALLPDDGGVVQSYEGADFGLEADTGGGNGEYNIFYDFENGGIGFWGGQDVMLDNVNGTLEISGFDTNGWIWHHLDMASPGPYNRAVFEFKVKFGSSRYQAYLKGHPASSVYDIQWGPIVEFIYGQVAIYDDARTLLDEYYDIDDWYSVRIEADANAGARGLFSLYMRNLTDGTAEKLIGEFPFHAPTGRLVDISTFGFIVFPDDKPLDPLYLDDVGVIAEH